MRQSYERGPLGLGGGGCWGLVALRLYLVTGSAYQKREQTLNQIHIRISEVAI